MLTRTFKFFKIVFLIALLSFWSDYNHAEAPNKKWQYDVDSYIRVAFGSGIRDKLIKLDTNDRIPLDVTCSVPSEATCKSMKDKFFRIVIGNINFRLKLDNNPILRVEFFDKVNAEAIKNVMREEFAGDRADISDGECELFYRLEDFKITNAKVLISADQSEKKIEACIAFQVAQSIGLGAIDGSGFAVNWSKIPGGMNELDQEGVRLLAKAIGFFEYIHMCSELRPGMTPEEVRQLLESPKSCISKIGGIQ